MAPSERNCTHYNSLGVWLTNHQDHPSYDVATYQYAKSIMLDNKEEALLWVDTMRNEEFAASVRSKIESGTRLDQIAFPDGYLTNW